MSGGDHFINGGLFLPQIQQRRHLENQFTSR
jgi:hypothetical protein